MVRDREWIARRFSGRHSGVAEVWAGLGRKYMETLRAGQFARARSAERLPKLRIKRFEPLYRQGQTGRGQKSADAIFRLVGKN